MTRNHFSYICLTHKPPQLHHVQTFLHFILYAHQTFFVYMPVTPKIIWQKSNEDTQNDERHWHVWPSPVPWTNAPGQQVCLRVNLFVCLYLLAQTSDLPRVCLSPNVYWDMLESPVTMNVISRLANWWMVQCLWHEHVPVLTKCEINEAVCVQSQLDKSLIWKK